jgi:hypothetical protein
MVIAPRGRAKNPLPLYGGGRVGVSRGARGKAMPHSGACA